MDVEFESDDDLFLVCAGDDAGDEHGEDGGNAPDLPAAVMDDGNHLDFDMLAGIEDSGDAPDIPAAIGGACDNEEFDMLAGVADSDFGGDEEFDMAGSEQTPKTNK